MRENSAHGGRASVGFTPIPAQKRDGIAAAKKILKSG
jgi:hypothetical protein